MKASVAAPAPPGSLSAYLELTKPRITSLVLVTVASGALLAPPGEMGAAAFLLVLAGSAFAAGGTNALNQVAERDADARMGRTRHRPIPSGRLDTVPAAIFAWAVSLCGIALLAFAANGLTAAIAVATLVLYVFAYTPLKRSSPLSMPLGAIPGALPIAGGWTAATGRLEPGAIALFLIVFLWQMPHFLSIGVLSREDYRRGGFRVLAVEDPSGRRSARQSLVWSGLLVPAAVLPGLLEVTGAASALGAVILGCGMVAAASAFARRPGRSAARRLFLASIAYLPLLLALFVADRAG